MGKLLKAYARTPTAADFLGDGESQGSRYFPVLIYYLANRVAGVAEDYC
jgi:hypothetical protein